MSQITVYAYFDAQGTRKYVDDTDFTFTGTWSAFGSYVAEQSAVLYSDTKFLAIRDNVGAHPLAPVTRYAPAKWSTLAALYERPAEETPSDGQDDVARAAAEAALLLAQEAYLLAQTGTDAAGEALLIGSNTYDLAQQAYDLAISQSGSFIPDETLAVKDFHIDWGHGTTQVDAADVPYLGAYSTVAAALDHLLYVPINITSFTNDVGTVEIGSTVGSVDLTWGINRNPQTQSIDQGIGSLGVAVRSFEDVGSFTSSRTYTLIVADGTLSADAATTSVNFRHRRYWGVSASASLNDAAILALSQEFSTNRTQTRTLSPAGQYLYFAYPASFGAATFTVNGLLNTAWTLETRDVVNASGHTESFRIYRSDNLLTGTYVVTLS